MKVLITGSRQPSKKMLNYAVRVVERCLEFGYEIVVGDEEGIDDIVIKKADEIGVKITVYGAYDKMRRKTTKGTNVAIVGMYITRNEMMVRVCDQCIAVWNGTSRGTKATYDYAEKLHKEVHLVTFS